MNNRSVIGLLLLIAEMLATVTVVSSCDTVGGAIYAFCYCLILSCIASGIVDYCLRDNTND